jgi:selenocysteine lyase/cysteine desulfurase
MARPGLHCAPETHRLLGTHETGAVRFSPGWATDAAQIDRAIDAVARVVARPVFAGTDFTERSAV